jgi:hypothetical protein
MARACLAPQGWVDCGMVASLLTQAVCPPPPASMSQHGAVRRMRAGLGYLNPPNDQKARSPRHSARAAARVCLSALRSWRWRSVGKWLWTEAWTETNICNVRTRRNRNIAGSPRRNERCDFSALLLSQRPVLRSTPRPRSFRAAPQDRNRSVTMVSGRPFRFIAYFKKFRAALRSRVLVTMLSSTSPS